MRVSPLAAAVSILALGAGSCGGASSPSSPSDPGEYAGVCAGASQSPYVLPYPVGTAYVVYQGYPPTVHSPSFKFAIDFTMAQRTVVTAARAGIVQYVQESYEDNDYETDHDNVVVVDHRDGTFARYVHLVKNGALVERGEQVARGQTVGLSGATGSGIAHLHFDVTTGCSQKNICQTIPVCFSNTSPHRDGLQRGQTYRAEPY